MLDMRSQITNQSRLATLSLPLPGSGPLDCLAPGDTHPYRKTRGGRFYYNFPGPEPEEIKHHPQNEEIESRASKSQEMHYLSGILLENTETKLLASTPLTF